MAKERILITGGAGYIGSHTFAELCRAGYHPVIADNFSNSHPEILRQLEAITGIVPECHRVDLADENAAEILKEKAGRVSGIIHFAALKSVGESVLKPLEYYRNNLNSLANVLAYMRDEQVKAFVFSSSCTVYGQPDILPVDENTPLRLPYSPYGKTKQYGEEMIRDFLLPEASLSAVLLRYFNPIGAHESALIGELPAGIPNNLMPYITRTALGILPELKVFGQDYNTPDGTAVRDYIHVSDLAEAHIAALRLMLDNRIGSGVEVINLGLGHGYSVLEVIESFERTSGMKLNYVFAPRRGGDIEKIWTRTDKMKEMLGLVPRRNIDDMTRTAWEWEKNYQSKFKKQ